MTDTWLGILGAVVGLVGAFVVLRALFADRSRGWRRCPECWYDMSGVPGMMCPECGRDVKRERAFLRTRRHWARAVLGALIIATGLGVGVVPKAVKDGWRSILPTSIVILMVDSDDQAFGRFVLGAGPLPPWEKELARRVSESDMAEWQRRWLLRRVVRARASWPQDEVLGVQVDFPRWLGAAGVTLLANLPGAQKVVVHDGSRFWHEIGVLPAATRGVKVRARVDLPGKAEWFDGWITLPVAARESREASHEPVSSRASAKAVQAFICPSVRRAQDQSGSPHMELKLRLHWEELSVDPDLNVSFRAELLCDSEVVASDFVSLRSRDVVDINDISSVLVNLGPYMEAATKDPRSWSIRLRGVVNPMHWPTHSVRYWAGSLVYTIEELLEAADGD